MGIGMKLSELIEGIDFVSKRIPENHLIRGIAYDSRRVTKGCIFFAIKGFHTDGHLYTDDAIGTGAVAVVHSEELPRYRENIAYLKTPDVRRVLSRVASRFYGNPSEKLKVIGVTGTDGKSTTVWLIHQLLSMLGEKSGFISTVHFLTGENMQKNPLRQSTPESPEIHAMLYDILESGKDYAVIEATSHGLSDRTARLIDVDFNIAVFTNVTHEHIEFHGSEEQYRYDKANLFRMSRDAAVINMDDIYHDYFASSFLEKFNGKDTINPPIHYYSLENHEAHIYATEIRGNLFHSTFVIHIVDFEREISLPLGGNFNILNSMAALLAVHIATKKEVSKIAPLLESVSGVPGRMEQVHRGQPFNVIVDYAHTPESFRRVFPLFRRYTNGKLIAVFGSAGERDTEKRPIQGRIAGEYSDILILTDEDPRGEERMKILDEIASGIEGFRESENLLLIPDREEAIRRALAIARENDTVVLLGKGHEESIIYDGYSIQWDEKKVAERILKEMGYGE